MQGIVGTSLSKHHVYVLACIRACMLTPVCQSGQLIVWGWLKNARVNDEPCGKVVGESSDKEIWLLARCATCLIYC